jgi:hypothetical protein
MRRHERRTVFQLETVESRTLLSGVTSAVKSHLDAVGEVEVARPHVQRDLRDDIHTDLKIPQVFLGKFSHVRNFRSRRIRLLHSLR